MLDTDTIPIVGPLRRAMIGRVRCHTVAVAECICLAATLALISSTRLPAQTPSPGACSASVPSSPNGRTAPWNAVGASIAVLDSTALTPRAGRTLSEALAARVPGVSVMRSSGVVGTGSRVRLRGPSGIVVTQQPLLYIDGIRVDGEQQSIALSAGGQAPSRLDDVPLDDVECIYVLRGPAATARFGTDAAGGIVYVITRRARADSGRIRAFLEGGATRDVGDYPANFGNATSCTRARAVLDQCLTSPLRSWSPLDADSPFRTGGRLAGGGRVNLVSGPATTLGVSGQATADGGAMRRNELRRYAATASGSVRAGSLLDVEGDLWFTDARATLPQVGNLIYSILNSALLGSSVDDPVTRGYRDFPLSALESFITTQRARRIGGVVRVRWTPAAWLSVNAVTGREDSRVRDKEFAPLIVAGPPLSIDSSSAIAIGALRSQRTSASVSAAATYGSTALRMTTALALDYLGETDRRESGGSWRAFDPVTKGVIATQTLAWKERRFIEVGVRRDVLERLIQRMEKPTYPFASASWDLGRESFLARRRAVSSLRLRAAYGESGDSRGYDAELGLAFVSPLPNGSTSWPMERTREAEGGFDVGFGGDRVLIGATVFTKRTSHGLLEAPAPPSAGGIFQILSTAGAWRNRGLELAARARIVEASGVRADVAITYSTLKNELTTLGAAGPFVSTTSRLQPGYPLYGAWAQRFTLADTNGDGVIVPSEVVADTAGQYLGSPIPTRELGVAPAITLGGTVTVAALVDYRGGFRSVNYTGRLHCMTGCAALYVPDASAAEQARAVDPREAMAAWIEDASFVKLRELSVSWRVPGALARRVGARWASLALVGRNLLTRTDFTGLDPEVSFTGQTRIDQQDLFTLPLPRIVSLRLDVGW
jgi:hypothetical protein